MREKIIIDKDIHLFLKSLDVNEFFDAFSVICNYGFYGVVPEEGTKERDILNLFKDKIDRYTYSLDNKKARNCEEYKKWRNDVFSRDNFTCQMRGKIGGKLNAHHLKHFATHIDLRYCLENGVTLCEKCHKEVHKRERQLCVVREIS